MRTSTRRKGLTVVEVLVALMLVAVGLLGMAGSTALALRTTLDAARHRAVVHRAAIRISTLTATGCAGLRDGSAADAAHQLTERWTVTPLGASFTAVTDSIAFMTARGPQSYTISAAVPC